VWQTVKLQSKSNRTKRNHGPEEHDLTLNIHQYWVRVVYIFDYIVVLLGEGVDIPNCPVYEFPSFRQFSIKKVDFRST